MRRTLNRAAAPVAGVLLLALALSGCSTASDSGSAGDYGTAQSEPAPAFEGDSSVDGGAVTTDEMTTEQFVPSEIPGEVSLNDSSRQVITTGYVTLTADDPIAASAKAIQIVEGAGGRIDGRTEQAPSNGDKGRASLTLRIPTDKLSATLEQLKELGDNASVQLTDVDVTTETQDLDARITALSASVDRLVALLATATDTAVLIDLETALSDRQGQLESMESQRRLLADQVAMSSVTLELVSVADAPTPEPDSFWDAVLAGLVGFGAFFTGLFFALGYALPWLLLVVIASAIILLVRRRRRRAHTAAESRDSTPADGGSTEVSAPRKK